MVLALALALGTAQAVLGGNYRLPVRGICAHQGDCQFFPGNTVEALASAARKGAAMVEFDVQRCKSGEFVLMHDATIDRLTTGTGRICDHTLEELKSYTYRRFPEKACRIATLDEVLDVLPKDGILINVHCYAGSRNMGAIVQKLKERGRLHQAFVTAKLKDIDLARKAAPEVAANNIERPGPRNRDWTPQENARFVSDAIAHRCQYLQLSRPWPRQYSDDAHAGGVKVIHFHAEKPEELKDLMVERGIDFVMTNHLTPMIEAFKALGLSMYEDDPITYIAHQGEEALAPSHSKAAYRLAVEHGLDYMKLDVRETKDGHVVLQHDATLKHVMGWDMPIRKDPREGTMQATRRIHERDDHDAAGGSGNLQGDEEGRVDRLQGLPTTVRGEGVPHAGRCRLRAGSRDRGHIQQAGAQVGAGEPPGGAARGAHVHQAAAQWRFQNECRRSGRGQGVSNA